MPTMFSQLESSAEARKRRSTAMMGGIVAEVLAVAVVILLSVLYPQSLPSSKQYIVAWLPNLNPPKPPAPKPKLPPHIVPRMVVPKIQPLEHPELIAPPVVELKPPKIQPQVTLPAVPLPQPPPILAQMTEPPKPKVVVPVQTGLFGGAPEKVTVNKPASQVQTGGFGSPEGFKGTAKGDSQGNVPKLGSFGLPEGPGYGNGTGGKHGVPGVIASAGFGSGIAGPGTGTGNGGTVAIGKFGQERQAPAAPARTTAPPPPADFQPIEIISKPSPIYTEEARKLGIQGDVALSVVFLANGSIRIVGVVKSLGHGLDEEAQQVATQIRFKPAQRAGQPADFAATVRIQFRLAGQSAG